MRRKLVKVVVAMALVWLALHVVGMVLKGVGLAVARRSYDSHLHRQGGQR